MENEQVTIGNVIEIRRVLENAPAGTTFADGMKHITLRNLRKLKEELYAVEELTITAWKAIVKRWAIKHSLTDRDAIRLAIMVRKF